MKYFIDNVQIGQAGYETKKAKLTAKIVKKLEGLFLDGDYELLQLVQKLKNFMKDFDGFYPEENHYYVKLEVSGVDNAITIYREAGPADDMPDLITAIFYQTVNPDDLWTVIKNMVIMVERTKIYE